LNSLIFLFIHVCSGRGQFCLCWEG